MTLIELMIGMAIFAVLLLVGVPVFSTWMQNVQIRVAAESIQSGLQQAQIEAVKRNTPVRFQLTNTPRNSCVLSTSGPHWIVSLGDPTGICGTLATDAGPILQSRSNDEGSANAVVLASQSTIIFNEIGKVVPVPLGNITINISNPTGGACVQAEGAMRCLNIIVSAAGQIRMCDPQLASTDPRGC